MQSTAQAGPKSVQRATGAPSRRDPRAALDAALRAAADAGWFPPCSGDPGLWFGSAPQRARAAERCGRCPVIDACGAYADTLPRSTLTGVWAGRDHTPGAVDKPPGRMRARKARGYTP